MAMGVGILHHNDGVILHLQVRLAEIAAEPGNRRRRPQDYAGEHRAIAAIIDQGATAGKVRVLGPRGEVVRVTHLHDPFVRRAIIDLKGATDPVLFQGQVEGVLELRPPDERPVDHEAALGGPRRLQHGGGLGGVHGHRLLDQDVQPT